MSADPIIYCLERLTDYRQFERLCGDIMAGAGYPTLEPFGGSNDRGRDALHVSRSDPDDVSIFAFSVRADWRQKLLNEDCKRIKEERHKLARVIFVTTAALSASEKDSVRQEVIDRYGWGLEIFDLERLRILLAGQLRHLIAKNPAIFCPPWFPRRGGVSISESRDTLVIDHVAADHALATWIARRLSLSGYRTWCYGTAPLAGENADDTVRLLIQNRAAKYLPILSDAALLDADLMGRCALAASFDDLTIPNWSREIDGRQLNSRLRSLTPARFDAGWSKGIRDLLDMLAANSIQPEIDEDIGRAIALRSYVPEPVIQQVPETVYASVFPAKVPLSIIVCELEQAMADEQLNELRKTWAFCQAQSRFLLSFVEPPQSVPLVPKTRLPEYAWDIVKEREGKNSIDAVKELVRRSLDVACYRAGLLWCEHRNAFYYPSIDKPQRNLSYRHVDGRNTRVAVTGEKSYGTGDFSKPFRYQLGPRFRVGRDEIGDWWVTTRIYVRVTECDGTPFEKKAIGRRRKAVTSSWWNKEWFARTLAIMQGLSLGHSQIAIGQGIREVSVGTRPLAWDCPVSIDLAALERIGDFQEEMAAMRFVEDEDNDSGESQDLGQCSAETEDGCNE